MYTLLTEEWVPVDRGSTTQLVVPSEAWIDSAQTPRRVRERIPRISDAMYQIHGGTSLASALGLTDAGRPQANDLLVILKEIALEADTIGGTTREIELSAKWVQRTLNDVLRDDIEPHPAPSEVRLLAKESGSFCFVSQPSFAEDPILRDTFEKELPLLAADVGLLKLTRYLSLTKLDDVVKTVPLPFGEVHGAAFKEISDQINLIKPFLFALVRADNSSSEGRVLPALRNLEFVFCERLILTYEFGGTQISREDAICYIDSHQEHRGRGNTTVGTVYLEIDSKTGSPHWFGLCRQLAQYLGVPLLADAFKIAFTALPEDRDRLMADRQIQPADLLEAHQQLNIVEEDQVLTNVLDSLNPQVPDFVRVDANDVDEDFSKRKVVSVQSHTGPRGEPGSESSSEAASVIVPPKVVPPPIDFSTIRVIDGVPEIYMDIQNKQRRRLSDGGPSRSPMIGSEEENRRIGARGEEASYFAERIRLKKMGKNPDLVDWVSKINELSPYDLTSIDEDDQMIYIEVKSTISLEPEEPFYISHGQLVEASIHRNRFYIYRVIDVDSESPSIIRWADPLGLIKDGSGRLLLAKAQMTLNLNLSQKGDWSMKL